MADMQNSGIVLFVVAGISLVLLLSGFFLYRVLYNRYLNKRLKGEIEKRNFINYKAVAIITGFSICAILIFYFGIGFIQASKGLDYYKSKYQEQVEQTYVKGIEITNFEQYPEYKEYRDKLLSNNLAGYEITIKTDGEFDCFVGLPKGKIGDYFFMPQYFIYIRYTGVELENAHMQRMFFYDDEDKQGYGGTGDFKPETLYIGNTLEPHFYLCIETIIKIAPKTSETKENWNSIPVYTQSRFVISN